MSNKLTPEQEAEIIALYQQHKSTYKVAAITQHGRNTVHRILTKHSVPMMINRFTVDQEDEIVRLYQSGMSISKISETIGRASWATFRNVLKRHGIERRRRGNEFREMTYEEQQVIMERWNSGESKFAICREIGVAQVTMLRWLKQIGFEPENRGARGHRHGSWKGGRHDYDGYIAVWVDLADPCYCMANTAGYVAEHRLNMARHLGRPLLKSESVHHINGDRSDNRIENLQLRIDMHGTKQLYCCSDCGSRNLKPIALDE